MNREEQETHIIMNKADSDEGYFRFSTTIEGDYNKVIRKIGGVDKLKSLKIATKDGKPIEWICKVPIVNYRFGVGKECFGREMADNHPFRIKS